MRYLCWGAVLLSLMTPTVIWAAPNAVWLELADCAELTSIDGKSSLSLLDNGVVQIREEKGGAKQTGTWTFDKERNRVTIAIGDKQFTYSRVVPTDTSQCILAAGSPSAANLLLSWFSVDSDPADMLEPPRR
jgi:hypothetical protein